MGAPSKLYHLRSHPRDREPIPGSGRLTLNPQNLEVARQVEADIRAVREAAPAPIVLKVIIETALLTDEEKVVACEISRAAGADFVLLGANSTMLKSKRPVVAVCAVRTGCGKSPVSRAVGKALDAADAARIPAVWAGPLL